MKKILFYQLEDIQKQVYPSIAKRLGYTMISLDDNDLDKSLKDLFTVEENHRGICEEFQDSFFVMNEMTTQDLMILLDAFQTAKMPYKGIKVMRTETNENWTLRELFQETSQEHQMFQNVKLLDQLLKSSNTVDLFLLKEEDREHFKQTLMSSFLLLKSGQFTKEELDRAIQEMKDALMMVKKAVH